MSVRPAETADAAAIAEIHVDTWRDAYAGILPDNVLLRMSVARERGGWSGAVLRGEDVYVSCDRRGGVTGFGSCGPNRLKGFEATSEIYTLYVAPVHQGDGYGRALVERMLKELGGRGHKSVIVWVLRENPARFFYEAMGARRVAERIERLCGADIAQTAFRWDV